MDSAVHNFKSLLQADGCSITKARLAVFTALHGQEPLTMHQLIARVKSIDRASVYRAIELFEQLGIVQRLNNGWKYTLELTDKFAEHHHHLTCTNCGRSITLSEHELERVIDKLALSHGFAAMAHQIEIQGLCAECQKR